MSQHKHSFLDSVQNAQGQLEEVAVAFKVLTSAISPSFFAPIFVCFGMACEKESEKCFTFIWVLKNADLCWQKQKERIESETFVVDEIEGTRWKLWLYPRGVVTENVALFLIREADATGAEYVKIEYDLAFLNCKWKVQKSTGKVKAGFHKDHHLIDYPTVSQSDVFDDKISKFLWNDRITVQCRIWKCVGEFSEKMRCLSCHQISVEKTLTVWRIEKFSSLDTGKKYNHEIKSLRSGDHLMSLELLSCKLNSEEIQCAITPRNPAIKSYKVTFLPLIFSNIKKILFKRVFKVDVPCKTDIFTFKPSFKWKLMTKKDLFLPNDVLSLVCMFDFCYGRVQEDYVSNVNFEILLQNDSASRDNSHSASSSSLDKERLVEPAIDALVKSSAVPNEMQNDSDSEDSSDSKDSSDSDSEDSSDPGSEECDSSSSVDSQVQDDLHENLVSTIHRMLVEGSSKDLIKDLKSLLNTRMHSDIKLRTSSGTHPAHKCILSARSPVFKTEFSNCSTENDCIDIEDMDGDTVRRMLRYVYSGEVEDLKLDSAAGLYAAAKKYKFPNLKSLCSSHLLKDLSLSNTRETFLFAVRHRDSDLKGDVLRFVKINAKKSQYSGEWNDLFLDILALDRETASQV
ncbi:hypothetical protein AVEN_165040-1 [Araneus ventricosus]|uniref:Uncharacterized protein n=1 Tax=Araneus ventricosus TaxID=182803 RepID=A0A4Y2NS57_ARAVE|nr:hypothetical protein AVEN_165040-1 [Araneus ventricosus]